MGKPQKRRTFWTLFWSVVIFYALSLLMFGCTAPQRQGLRWETGVTYLPERDWAGTGAVSDGGYTAEGAYAVSVGVSGPVFSPAIDSPDRAQLLQLTLEERVHALENVPPATLDSLLLPTGAGVGGLGGAGLLVWWLMQRKRNGSKEA